MSVLISSLYLWLVLVWLVLDLDRDGHLWWYLITTRSSLRSCKLAHKQVVDCSLS